jgi:hypothetical protein
MAWFGEWVLDRGLPDELTATGSLLETPLGYVNKLRLFWTPFYSGAIATPGQQVRPTKYRKPAKKVL